MVGRSTIAVTAAESVGVAARVMEMAVAYAKERKQFERPIGTYQAVSHACAQMLLETEGARSVTCGRRGRSTTSPRRRRRRDLGQGLRVGRGGA